MGVRKFVGQEHYQTYDSTDQLCHAGLDPASSTNLAGFSTLRSGTTAEDGRRNDDAEEVGDCHARQSRARNDGIR